MTFEDDLLALEARVLKAAAGDFLTAVAELRAMLAASAPGIRQKLISLAIPDIETAARAGIAEAHQSGAEWAVGSAELLPGVAGNEISDARARTAVAPRYLEDPVDGLNTRTADAKARAVTLLAAGSPVEEALGPIFGAASSVRATIETQINAASNTASQTVGEAVRSPMVWEAERDACVYCLGLAGAVVEQAGDLFPKADLYDDGKTGQQTLSQPPLHPHCRCRLAVLGDRSYADALQREAQRSILRGFSLRSESNAVRVRAAARLLERDPVAPKSVKAYAAKAVKEGRFPRGRDVPAGRPRLIVLGPGESGPLSDGPKAPPPPPRFDLSGFKKVKPESGLVAARKTNPLQSVDRAYQINCSHVVNAVELRQRGLDVVATSRPSLRGRFTEETAADWVAPDGQAPQIFPVSSYYAGRDLQGLEENTAHLPKGARGFVRVGWQVGGAHIFNWEKVGDEYAPGLKFHEGQVEDVTSTQARDYFKRVKSGSVAWFRVDDAEPAVSAGVTVQPAAAQAAQAAQIKAAKKAEAERKAREEGEWQAMIEEGRRQRRERNAILDKLGNMTRGEVIRRYGLSSPEYQAFAREELRRNNPS